MSAAWLQSIVPERARKWSITDPFRGTRLDLKVGGIFLQVWKAQVLD
jgi:hypothetical protein